MNVVSDAATRNAPMPKEDNATPSAPANGAAPALQPSMAVHTPTPVELRKIGRDACETVAALDDTRVLRLLQVSAADWDGGKSQTRDGVTVRGSWADFGAMHVQYAQEVVPEKGAGRWYSPVTIENGRCRDCDIGAITQLFLDADNVGDWQEVRRRVDAAGLACVLQRSASHAPSRGLIKWHASLPLAAYFMGSKSEWRRIHRHAIAAMSMVAGLDYDLDAATSTGAPQPTYGFDHRTDRLGHPCFLGARRRVTDPPPETLCIEGKAFDLEAFCRETAFDPRAAREATTRATRRPRQRKQPMLPDGRTAGATDSLLAVAFAEEGWLGGERGDGKVAVRCPWEASHSCGQRFDGSTVLFPPRQVGGPGYFHCSHAHCDGRTLEDVLRALPAAVVARAFEIRCARAMPSLPPLVPRFRLQMSHEKDGGK